MGRLSRRTVDLSSATSFDKSNIALEALGVLGGIVAFVLAIVAVVRSSYRKGPYIILIISAIFYTLSEAFYLGAYIDSFDVPDFDSDDDNEQTQAQIQIALNTVATMFANWSIALIVASAFQLLYDRAAASSVPYHTARKVFNWIGIGLLIFLAGLIAVVTGVAQGLLEITISIDFDQYLNLANAATDIGYVELGFLGALLIDYFISVLLVHFKLKDKVTIVLLAAWWPVMVIEFLFSLAIDIFFAVNLNVDPNTANNISTADNAIFFLLPVASMIIIAAIGLSTRGGGNPYAPREYGAGYGQQPMYNQGPQSMYGQPQQQYPAQQGPYQYAPYQPPQNGGPEK